MGDPVVSSATSRPETPGHQLQALAAHSSAKERTHECNRGIAKRRKRSAARWAAGSRSTFILPMKPGNWSRRTRWREGKTERGCLMLDPGPGNTSEASYSETRITVTTQDSSPGLQRLAVRRTHHQRNRMLYVVGHIICPNVCTYGSVGGLGGQPPRPTRPHARNGPV